MQALTTDNVVWLTIIVGDYDEQDDDEGTQVVAVMDMDDMNMVMSSTNALASWQYRVCCRNIDEWYFKQWGKQMKV